MAWLQPSDGALCAGLGLLFRPVVIAAPWLEGADLSPGAAAAKSLVFGSCLSCH